MNKVIEFFDYERCFKHYAEMIMNLRQLVTRGETIKAKPALLVALIDKMTDEQCFRFNMFLLDEELEEHYTAIMHQYTKDSQFKKPTDINNPYWHLQSDGFWKLLCAPQSKTPSKAWLKKNVIGAYLDESLWILLQNEEWRQKLRDFIIEHKLAVPSRAGNV